MRKKSVTAKQIQALDKLAIEKFGVPSLALMENAGRFVACEVLRQIKRVKGSKVCIVCGLGNNAGDGFVAARHLMNAGIKPLIFLIGQGRQLKNDAAVNYCILKKLKYPIKEIVKNQTLPGLDLRKADVVVDAIFGVGLNREVKNPFRNAIEIINENNKRILAVDVPSGLDATDGKIYGACVKAKTTITFTCAKKGFFKRQGPKHTGNVIIADIGIPVQLV